MTLIPNIIKYDKQLDCYFGTLENNYLNAKYVKLTQIDVDLIFSSCCYNIEVENSEIIIYLFQFKYE
jgi:hypothetical protein